MATQSQMDAPELSLSAAVDKKALLRTKLREATQKLSGKNTDSAEKGILIELADFITSYVLSDDDKNKKRDEEVPMMEAIPLALLQVSFGEVRPSHDQPVEIHMYPVRTWLRDLEKTICELNCEIRN